MDKKFNPQKYGMMVCQVCSGYGCVRSPGGVKVCQNCGGFGLIKEERERSAQKEKKTEMKKLMDTTGGVRVLIVEDSTLFRQLFKKTLHDRFPTVEIYEATHLPFFGDGAMFKIFLAKESP